MDSFAYLLGILCQTWFLSVLGRVSLPLDVLMYVGACTPYYMYLDLDYCRWISISISLCLHSHALTYLCMVLRVRADLRTS